MNNNERTSTVTLENTLNEPKKLKVDGIRVTIAPGVGKYPISRERAIRIAKNTGFINVLRIGEETDEPLGGISATHAVFDELDGDTPGARPSMLPVEYYDTELDGDIPTPTRTISTMDLYGLTEVDLEPLPSMYNDVSDNVVLDEVADTPDFESVMGVPSDDAGIPYEVETDEPVERLTNTIDTVPGDVDVETLELMELCGIEVDDTILSNPIDDPKKVSEPKVENTAVKTTAVKKKRGKK